MASARQEPPRQHPGEPHQGQLGDRLNWLRAGVLGANDGVVSTAGLVVGVAGAAASPTALLTAGVAGMVAGAFSMAGGEYVSVSTQRDTEKAMLRIEARELKDMPEAEERELAGLYEQRGLSPKLAAEVAKELSAKDALHAHAEAELGIDPERLTSPWQAAWASWVAFSTGALLPLAAIVLPPAAHRVWICALATAIALAITGFVSAHLGGARRRRAVIRNVGVGAVTMTVTYLVGTVFGVAVG